MITAALDPGSVHCGLAAGDGSSVPLAYQVDVRAGDLLAAAVEIVDWLVSVGATSLAIEWAAYYATGDIKRDMARAKELNVAALIIYNVTRLCRDRGIQVAADEDVARGRGPGLVNVSRWRGEIGGLSVKDAATGHYSSKDAAVRAALIRHYGADEVRALGPGDHRRDAAGLFLGVSLFARSPWLPVERTSGGARKRPGRKRHGRSGYQPTAEQKVRAVTRKRERRHALAALRTRPPTLASRILLALAAGPLPQGQLAVALGMTPGGLGCRMREHMAPLGANLVRVPAPSGRGPLWYAAPTIQPR